ncbi:MAG: amidohydrolase family protein, partial [Rhodobacteraceae bacterium]|nr:amidohydrolase family protein [Paracoccaceae bacterium]
AMDFALEPTIHIMGLARLKDAYLARTLAEGGAPIAYASDWPVTDVSVLRGIQCALTRPPFAAPGAEDQRLSLMETLHAYTAGGAWAAHWDGLTGTLRPGMAADLVVLNGNIEACAADEIAGLDVALTVAGGRITWRA